MDTCGGLVCVCAVATHKPRRVGVYWILMGCLGKTLSPSLLFSISFSLKRAVSSHVNTLPV